MYINANNGDQTVEPYLPPQRFDRTKDIRAEEGFVVIEVYEDRNNLSKKQKGKNVYSTICTPAEAFLKAIALNDHIEIERDMKSKNIMRNILRKTLRAIREADDWRGARIPGDLMARLNKKVPTKVSDRVHDGMMFVNKKTKQKTTANDPDAKKIPVPKDTVELQEYVDQAYKLGKKARYWLERFKVK